VDQTFLRRVRPSKPACIWQAPTEIGPGLGTRAAARGACRPCSAPHHQRPLKPYARIEDWTTRLCRIIYPR